MNKVKLNLKEIGARIKKHRKELRMSMDDVAVQIGISPSYVALIEKGNRKPPIDLLIKIGAMAGVSIDYLIFGESVVRGDENQVTLRRLENNYSNEEIKNGLKIMEYSLDLQKKGRAASEGKE